MPVYLKLCVVTAKHQNFGTRMFLEVDRLLMRNVYGWHSNIVVGELKLMKVFVKCKGKEVNTRPGL